MFNSMFYLAINYSNTQIHPSITMLGWVAERLKAPVLKTDVGFLSTAGSNPAPSATVFWVFSVIYIIVE